MAAVPLALSARIERWPQAQAFTISSGSKTEAIVVVAESSDGVHTGRGECVPYLRYGEVPTGAYFHSRTGARTALAAAGAAVVLTPIYVLADETIRHTPPWLPSLPPAIRTGLIPVVIACAVLAVVYLGVRQLFSASPLEAVQALLTFLIVAFVVLTVTGSLFRGQAMALAWPWAMAATR